VDNNGVEQCLHASGAAKESCVPMQPQVACKNVVHLAPTSHTHIVEQLMRENAMLMAEWNQVVQERDAAVILAREMHKQMVEASGVFGILALSNA
jgi:hypothetical protein